MALLGWVSEIMEVRCAAFLHRQEKIDLCIEFSLLLISDSEPFYDQGQGRQ